MKQLTLFELNQLLRATLDTHLEPSYWVIAEIGELRTNPSGHCYMELVQKDQQEVVAKIRANIWSYTFRKLGPWFEGITGMPLKKGIKVLFNVQVQFHELYGMSLVVRDIDPNFTLGERARKRQETIQRLENEDLLDKNKQTGLPLVPRRIAVISSSSAAGYEDFLKQLRQNPYGYVFEPTLFQSLMQGPEAENQIIKNLERINEQQASFDITVIIRGGGSQVDLDCFDGYQLARIVAEMPMPVVSGVGHERDQSVLDLVVHTNLHTPTAVAEFLVNGVATFESILLDSTKKLQTVFHQKVSRERTRLHGLQTKLEAFAMNRLHREKEQLNMLQSQLHAGYRHVLKNHEKVLTTLREKLTLMDPTTLLKRGYSITTINGIKLAEGTNVKKGDKIKTYTADQTIGSTVDQIEKRT